MAISMDDFRRAIEQDVDYCAVRERVIQKHSPENKTFGMTFAREVETALVARVNKLAQEAVHRTEHEMEHEFGQRQRFQFIDGKGDNIIGIDAYGNAWMLANGRGDLGMGWSWAKLCDGPVWEHPAETDCGRY